MAAKPNEPGATDSSVETFLAAIAPDERRTDARAGRANGARHRRASSMWGPSIVGFGVRRYRHGSGREGEICKVGFSPRKRAFALYVTENAENDPRAIALGKVTTGNGCIYFKRLADIDDSRLPGFIADTCAGRPT